MKLRSYRAPILAMLATLLAFGSILGCQGVSSAQAAGGMPLVAITPAAVSFGNQVLNTTTPETVTVVNRGMTAVVVQNVSLTGSSEFKLQNWVGTTSLAPGGNLQLTVNFTPTSAGSSSASLTIQTDASSDPTQAVTVSGAGETQGNESVTLSPANATVQANLSQQFTASVKGTSNTAVIWLVNGVAGGDGTLGTVSSGGLYTAPQSVPTSGSVHVTAESAADSTKSAQASVTILPAAGKVTVTVSPVSADVTGGGIQQFTAAVAGTSNTMVNWSVNGVLGGNDAVGTISTSGLYTAPSCSSQSNVTVTGTSQYDSEASANAAVTVSARRGNGNYYVAPTGSDNNDGSGCSPWATINHAASKAGPGSTVYVEPGTYNQTVSTSHSGTSGSPITFISETKWGAHIDGGGAKYIWYNTGNYVRIYGFDITDLGTESAGGCDSGPVAIINYGTNVEIAHNRLHGLGSSSRCFSAAIDSVTGSTSTSIYANVIHNLAYDINDQHCCYGIYLQSTGKVYNNLIYHGATYGITSWHGATDLYIYNNTVDDMQSKSCIQIGSGDSGNVQDPWYDVENNILSNCISSGLYVYTNNLISTSSIFRNNLIYKNGSDFTYGGACSPTLQACGLTVTGTVSGDPLYVSSGTDFYLQLGSPAIDAANSDLVPSTDLDGNPRPSGSGYDIGAYEYQYP